jgi:hypothetical protein
VQSCSRASSAGERAHQTATQGPHIPKPVTSSEHPISVGPAAPHRIPRSKSKISILLLCLGAAFVGFAARNLSLAGWLAW